MNHLKISSAFITLLLIFQLFVLTVQGQTSGDNREKPSSFEISFASTLFLGQTIPGMTGHYILFLSERLGTGLSLFTVQSQVNQNFGYSIVNPQLMMGKYGWINQFILINNKYVKFKFNFTNGLMQVRLLNETRAGNNGVSIPYPNLDPNYYYFIEPGTALSLRLFGFLYLTGGINYRFVYGKSHFSDRKDFQNTDYSLGLSMINNFKKVRDLASQ